MLTEIKISPVKTRFTVFTVIVKVFLVLYSLLLLTLLIWGVITSFKAQSDFRLNSYGFPKKWELNIITVLRQFYVGISTSSGTRYVGVGEMYFNSVMYSLGCALTSNIISCLTAYLCAKFPYKFSKILYAVILMVMIIPIVGSLPSELYLAKLLHLYDSIYGQWFLKANFMGAHFLIFYSAFKGVPMAFTEAAKIDGAGNFSVMLRIVIPLIRGIFFTLALLSFVAFWNDYNTALIWMPHHPTVAYGVLLMANTSQTNLAYIPTRLAGTMMILVPILIVFIAFSGRFMGNITIGGIKG